VRKKTRANRLILERLETRITPRAKRLLDAECQKRYQAQAALVTQGAVISELIEEKYGPQAEEQSDDGRVPALPVRRRLAKTA